MRIITGRLSGSIIEFPKGLELRPTMDFAREGLFNILIHRYNLSNYHVLDLFAGSGSVCFEFISNEVKEVTAIDNSIKVINHLRNTSKRFNISNIIILKDDSLRFLTHTCKRFNIIFADPPYDYLYYQKLINLVFERKLLLQNGLLILEHDKKHKFSENEHFTELRTYGKTHFSFFVFPNIDV